MDAVRIKQDFLEDIRRAARAQLSPETPNGFAAVVLGLVANAIRERDRERKQSFADVTAARMALRDLLDNPHSVAARDEARLVLDGDFLGLGGVPAGSEDMPPAKTVPTEVPGACERCVCPDQAPCSCCHVEPCQEPRP